MPNYLAVPELLAGSDMLATLPRSLALQATRHHDLVLLEPPYHYSPMLVEAVWHELNRANAVHRWTRDTLRRAAETVGKQEYAVASA